MTFLSAAAIRLSSSAVLSLALFTATAQASDQPNPAASRIVSIGGTITEILYDLGAESRIVAVDTTSTYPAPAGDKPDVGYMRALSAEGILAQTPDLVLAEDGSGPPDALAILSASAVPMVTIATPPRGDAIPQKIRDVGKAVGLSDKADALAATVDADLKALAKTVSGLEDTKKKRVMFVLSLANGRVMAGGTDTEANAIIELAGGINAASAISGYKPLNDEAVIAAAPDVVLVMNRGSHLATPDQVFGLPAFQSTPAASSKALLSMDGLYLLGFGPRTPEAARMLGSKLYPDVIKP
jgi:iron complex transport system substrate-binding protein